MDQQNIQESLDFLGELHRLHRKLYRYYQNCFRDLNLTGIQVEMLHFLMSQPPEREVYQKDLEAFLDLRGASVTSALKTLEKNNLVQRKNARHDARYKYLIVTEKALRLRDEMVQRMETYASHVTQGISHGDFPLVHQVMALLSQNAED